MGKEYRVEFVVLMAWIVIMFIIIYGFQNYYIEDNSFLEATEENELDNPNMIQGMNNSIQCIRMISENTKVKVEYCYSIEYKDDTGKTRTVKCFGYKERPKYYELVYQYENTSGIAYIDKEKCIKISDIDETEIIRKEKYG